MPRSALTARPTTYRGIQMRSRLEARFAAYLDSVGMAWEYEPRAFANEYGQYLPDFQILSPTAEVPCYIEVKPTVEMALKAMERMQIIWSSEPLAALIVATAEMPYLLTSLGEHRFWHCSLTFKGWPD